MVALNNFNPRDYAPEMGANFQLWPAGWHKVMIAKSEWKATKANDGSLMLVLTLNGCPDSPGVGGLAFDVYLNLGNKNPAAVNAAAGELSCIAYAAGANGPVQDSSQLHNMPFYAEFAVETMPPKDGKEARQTNRVKAYKDVQGRDPAQIAASVGGKTAASASTAAAAPAPAAPAAPFPNSAPVQNGAPFPGVAPAPAPTAPFPGAAPAMAAPAASAPAAWQQNPGAAPGAAPGAGPWGPR